MSLLTVDRETMNREVQSVKEMFPGVEGRELAEKMGFQSEWREEEKDHSFHKNDTVVYTYGEKWCAAQRGSRPYGLIAHVWHDTLEEALVDAINRCW